ncbi:RNA polymerase sigma-70 factor [Rapidithrix thailandica]|uniref:RNA polymerase sigma factor n=1 Tax=Rapidithrix thailandica TaxID=413964 RepID=A0AAW9RVE2_9BACT
MHENDLHKEKEWVGKLKKGDQSAFDWLFFQYEKKLFAFISGFCKSKADAEEVLQETFIKVWENRHKLEVEKSFGSFLFTIAKNTTLNLLRSRQYHSQLVEELRLQKQEAHSATEQQIIYGDYQSQLEHWVDNLTPRRKQIFIMSRQEGMNYTEIAQKLQVSTKFVEKQMSLSLKTIKKHLQASSILTSFAALLYFFFE